ncbi:MAG: DUF4159 domain-containing protein [Parvibaculaceae bacterium]|nr:DUF4159 domain-containing protein [Parvibaculaceae bacterium]
MSALVPLSFTTPWLLLALAALPAIWWLLRVTPPLPKRVRFPAIRLLMGLAPEEETPAHTPLWLLALRLLVAALAILALAGPTLNPATPVEGSGPLLLVLDDGWAAAGQWPDRQEAMETIIAEARRNNRPVMIAGTAPRATAPDLLFHAPDDALALARGWLPQPLAPDRAALTLRLQKMAETEKTAPDVIWLGDGVDNGDAEAFAASLTKLAKDGSVSLYTPRAGHETLALTPPATGEGGFTVSVVRPGPGEVRTGFVRALGEDGRVIAEEPYAFASGADKASLAIALPLELRNRLARLEVAGERSAGAVSLLDGRWHRRTVGLVSGGPGEDSQPLLSDLYFLRRALAPYAEIVKTDAGKTGASEIATLLAHPLSVLVLADVGTLSGPDREAVARWVEAGGLLIRFAGPRLAAQSDDLVPVPLRTGGRAMGGALSWTTPQRLSPFEPQSPFYGLDIPPDVTVNRQVLAEPGADMQGHVWARLQDGTPLVTALNRGKGRIVLFHVTANVQWSNLPYSGLYVEMLRRLLDDAQAGGADTGATQAESTMLAPVSTLDGFGQLGIPPVTTLALPREALGHPAGDARHPPGLYGPAASPSALNAIGVNQQLSPMPASLPGIVARPYAQSVETSLAPLAWALVFGLLLLDTLATFHITGRFETQRVTRPARFIRRKLGRGSALILVFGFGFAFGHAGAVRADDAFAIKASHDTHLAYVITGDPAVDQVSEEGLQGLTTALEERTALEPGAPMGVDPGRDDLAFFPVLYWPVTEATPAPSPQAVSKLNIYMKNGGLILFDTRDQNGAVPGMESPQAARLKAILSRLDVPQLVPVPEGHVLGRSFYLLQSFPGRFDGGTLWVEGAGSAGDGQTNDGVSAIVIGSNDFAGAWAVDRSGQPLFPCVPGGEVQRQYAYRFGVNLVMYALTGNYKGDQVHVPALLDRLGQ